MGDTERGHAVLMGFVHFATLVGGASLGQLVHRALRALAAGTAAGEPDAGKIVDYVQECWRRAGAGLVASAARACGSFTTCSQSPVNHFSNETTIKKTQRRAKYRHGVDSGPNVTDDVPYCTRMKALLPHFSNFCMQRSSRSGRCVPTQSRVKKGNTVGKRFEEGNTDKHDCYHSWRHICA
jgi:hypothetical protein